MSNDDRKSKEGHLLSDRAQKLEDRIREVQSSTSKVQEEVKQEIDKLLTDYLGDVADEDDTKIRNIREIARRAGLDLKAFGPHGTVPSPPPDAPEGPVTAKTMPSVTRPSPAALAESRFEPDYRVPAPLSPPQGLELGLAGPPSSGGRILVVDDDPDILETLKDVLQDEGYRVCAAPNGKEGLKRFFQMAPNVDLILLDMMMPGMSGYEFLEIFDETPWAYVPVVIISANLRDQDMHLDPETQDHIVFVGKSAREAMKKPIYLEGFLETVKKKVAEGKRRRPRS